MANITVTTPDHARARCNSRNSQRSHIESQGSIHPTNAVDVVPQTTLTASSSAAAHSQGSYPYSALQQCDGLSDDWQNITFTSGTHWHNLDLDFTFPARQSHSNPLPRSNGSLQPSVALAGGLSPASTAFSPENFSSDVSQPDLSYYNTPSFDQNFQSLDLDEDLSPAFGTLDSALGGRALASSFQNTTFPPHGISNDQPVTFSETQPALDPYPSATSAAQSGIHQLVSPVVRVESFENEDVGSVSAPSLLCRSTSQKSSNVVLSNSHLSPYHAQASWIEDADSRESNHLDQEKLSRPIGNDIEHEDTYTHSHTLRRSGLDPQARAQLTSDHVLSIDELEQQRQLQERKADVQHWLERSELGWESAAIDINAFHHRPTSFTVRRRAKSTNDAATHRPLASALHLEIPEIAHIPGPGLTLNVPSDFEDYDVDEYEDPLTSESESPPPELRQTSQQPASKPPNDQTSNAAMMRFNQRSKDLDTSSLAATLGSRRVSESDIGSLAGAGGISKLLHASDDIPSGKGRTPRRPSFLGNILPKRSNSNMLKRKPAHSADPAEANNAMIEPNEGQAMLSATKRIGSWGRSRSPKFDSSITTLAQSSNADIPIIATPSGPVARAKDYIRRSRSKSDLGGGKAPGLADLMTRHGGPPMVKLASPGNDLLAAPNQGAAGSEYLDNDESGDEDGLSQEGVVMDLSIRSDPIQPTREGFRENARRLNPRLQSFLLDRLIQEQERRYKRLLETRVKHAKATAHGKCGSKGFCFATGGNAKQLPPKPSDKSLEATFQGFAIVSPGSADECLVPNDGSIIIASFPQGIPLPPVKRLPAEFECPFCFEVKKFQKPSDWTKHVHEDVQPFTCTFEVCSEPKSFKRKADWVRHESERHRQLEYWQCTAKDCKHTCYRKDNFVHHLVREHKVPEPKVRTRRSSNARVRSPGFDPTGGTEWQSTLGFTLTGETANQVWDAVERCRHEPAKQPQTEPCRFCGNICSSWKKLTVHLAKHLEQISMPVLPLIENNHVDADTIVSPVTLPTTMTQMSLAPPSTSQRTPALYSEHSLEIFNLPPQQTINPIPQATRTYPNPQAFVHRQHLTPAPAQHFYKPNNLIPPGNTAQSYPMPSQRLSPHPRSNQSVAPHSSNAPTRTPLSVTPVTSYGQQQVYQSPLESHFPDTSLMGGMSTSHSAQTSQAQSYPFPAYTQHQYQQQGFPY